MKFRGALLGCGQVSKHHLTAWNCIDEVEIVALYNRTVSKAVARANEFGIPVDKVYSDFIELLNTEEIDFVDIATAPEAHHEQVLAAAEAGKHILCQKPLALTLDEVTEMISACKKADVLFMVNENWRWRSRYRELKRLLSKEIIGQPRQIRVTMYSDICLPSLNGEPPPLALKQPYTAELNKLIVFEWGIHIIDVLRFLFGEVRSVFARMEKTDNYFKGEDRALMVLDVEQVMAVVDISWASPVVKRPSSESIYVEGEKGSIVFVHDNQGTLLVQTRDGVELRCKSMPHSTPESDYQDSYTAAQRHFVNCLISGKVPETEASDNRHTLLAAFAAYESASRKQVVYLPCESA